jgi:mitochondrial fission protein ELM1
MADALPDSCWLLHDGAAGNRRQVQALAQALGLDAAREWPLSANAPARWGAPRWWPGAGFGRDFAQALAASPPALAIGCGRLAALATRQARAAGARVVQILSPRLAPRHWDLVIAPRHDRLQGDNVLSLLGSLNPVDDRWLAAARTRWPDLAPLDAPRTAVLLGGPTAATRFDREALQAMCARLEGTLAQEGGTLLLCGSRRTPRAWADTLRARFGGGAHRLWFEARDGDNFYEGALAWAQRLVVTPDSVNMLSEACATALPVFVAEPNRASGRVGDFVQELLARERVRAQQRELPMFAVEPLRETARIAELVRQRLKLR